MTRQETYKNKSYNLRISDELKYKLNYIKQKKGYNKLSYLLIDILENYVNEYEAEYEEIRIEQESREE